MSTPPNSTTANAESLAAKTALQTAANSEFIDQANYAIENATAQGLYRVVLTTFLNCNVLDLQTYFIGLGYQVDYPDLLNPNLSPYNPAELFGECWNNYWSGGGMAAHLNNPVRIRLEWKIP